MRRIIFISILSLLILSLTAAGQWDRWAKVCYYDRDMVITGAWTFLGDVQMNTVVVDSLTIEYIESTYINADSIIVGKIKSGSLPLKICYLNPDSMLFAMGAPGIKFGDLDTYVCEAWDDALRFVLGGTSKLTILTTSIQSYSNYGYEIFHNQATATTPVYAFRDDANTGIGRAGADSLSLIAGGTEVAQLRSGGSETKVRTVYTPSSVQLLAATDTLKVSKTIMRVQGKTGAITLTSTPTIQHPTVGSAITEGTMLIIEGRSNDSTLTLRDVSNLEGSGLQFDGAADITLGKGDIVQLIYSSADACWYEISRSDN